MKPPPAPRGRGLRPSRRAVLPLLTVGAVMPLLPSRLALPAERALSLGLESVLVEAEERERIGRRLATVSLTAVHICVGRVDWTAFPWDAHPDSAASTVDASGRDEIAGTIEAVRASLGDKVGLTLTLDALAPRLLAARPQLAGEDDAGNRHDEVAAVSALGDGEVGDRIVELAGEVCRRYRPHRLALTELFVDTHTFGERDLASYRRHSGVEDWPCTEKGSIDTAHPSLGRWRSQALATLLARVREEISPTGALLDMDVRAAHSGDPAAGRPLSGHDYGILLRAVDRLAVWNYIGLDGRSPGDGARIAQGFTPRFQDRFSLSTGLWADDGILPAAVLRHELRALASVGAPSVAVTPLSLLEEAHWEVLEREWGR